MLIHNRYEITRKIGEGTYSNVYEATNIIKGNKVAIKFEKKSNNIASKLIHHEIQMYLLLKKYKIDKVVSIKSFGVFCDHYYIIMEYLPFSLEDKRDNLPFYFKQIKDIIHHLHEKCIVHRDIKPDNFMMSEKGNIYLIDLGMACEINPNQPLHNIVGSVRYCSFRVHEGLPYDKIDDMISVYYMFFELYSNKPLPWSNLRRDKNRDMIHLLKKNIDFERYYSSCIPEMKNIIEEYNTLIRLTINRLQTESK